jgi:sensor histidine kinase regulating citrate/malate metabolism
MIEMFGGVFMDEKITGQIMLDGISEGVIAVDNNNRICFINKKAKEIFGITYKQDIGHREGKINKGDIVIIGDTSIGLMTAA